MSDGDTTEYGSQLAQLGERCYGVEDIDDEELRRMCDTIRHVVWSELGQSVNATFVMGSFARSEARKIASDIDLRIVVGTPVPDQVREDCERELKTEYGPDIAPSICGYLDPHITVLHPGDGSPHVEVSGRV